VTACLQDAAPQPDGGMLGAGGTCEYSSPTECRRPASTSVTGFCACPRSGCSVLTISSARDWPCPAGHEWTQRGADRVRMNPARGWPCPLDHEWTQRGADRVPGAGVCRQV